MERHNLSRTAEYKAWRDMRQRCHNVKSLSYPNYGDRGIEVHTKWKHSFIAFIEHIGLKPSPEMSLDRIDNDKGYIPGNIRWATPKTQANNKRQPKDTILFKGETAKEATVRLGFKDSTIRQRLQYGWNLEEAFTTPLNKRRNKQRIK